MNISVLSNFQLEGIHSCEFTPSAEFLDKKIDALLAFYNGKELICTIDDNQIELENGLPTELDIPIFPSYNLTLEGHNVLIHDLIVSYISLEDKYCLAPDTGSIRIIHYPTQGMRIGFDFSEVGSPELIQVQIQNPDGSIATVKSCATYKWKDSLLMCDLPSGMKGRLRVRYPHSEWSDWFKFTTKRKMSL